MTPSPEEPSHSMWRPAALREIFAIDLRTLALFRFGLAVMMSPIAPFFSDWLYRRLNEVARRSELAVGPVHPLVRHPQGDVL